MARNIYICLLIMAGVTYAIRVLPLTVIRREIKNRRIRAFLYYVPYGTLAVMTVPAILDATGSAVTAISALAAATALAWFGGNLLQVSLLACAVVFLLDLMIR